MRHVKVKTLLKTLMAIAFLYLVIPFDMAIASVVMSNTRVIYPGNIASQTVQIKNNDNIPYVIQLWTDINNPASSPENSDGPFVVLPAMFRIEAQTGQSVRIIFTGSELPKDRESLFYLNFVQVPPANLKKNENKMMVLLRNRMKIFYRPIELNASSDDVVKLLYFKIKKINGSWIVSVKNDSGFYVSFATAVLVSNGSQEINVTPNMVAPHSQEEWPIEKKYVSLDGFKKIKIGFMNDYGGVSHAEVSITE